MLPQGFFIQKGVKMAALLREIAEVKDEIERLKQRERELPEGEKEERLALIGLRKASTELLTALISEKQGQCIFPPFVSFMPPISPSSHPIPNFCLIYSPSPLLVFSLHHTSIRIRPVSAGAAGRHL